MRFDEFKNCENLKFSNHAIRKMFEREIYPEEIVKTIKNGEIIEEYPDDYPYPSYLILLKNKKVIHVVVAVNKKLKECYIITAYIPLKEKWKDNFKIRRES